ncbi:MAG: hypothetical protein WBG90_09915, partial [Saonia sp.]
MKIRILVFAIMLLTCPLAEGQEPLKATPALEILNKYPKVRDFTLSTSGNEAYFTLQSPLEELSVIAYSKKRNKVWTEPLIAAFSGCYKDLEPFLSPNQLRLYFASNRPLKDSITETKDFDIWYVERKDLNSQWSGAKNVGAPVNTEHNEFYPALAANHNLYFTSDALDSKGKDDIFFSEWANNQYTTPISLGGAINTEGFEFNAYIA